jgi:sugar diacid utilization regulator
MDETYSCSDKKQASWYSPGLMTEQDLASLKLAHAVQDAMLQVMLEGGTIAALVECLAERIGNPVAVADPLFHLITSNPKWEHGDRFRREAISRGGTAHEIFDDPIIGPLFRRVTEERRPTLFRSFPAKGMEKRRLMAPILAGKDIVGFVTVLEESRLFQDSDAAVLQQAALVLALELLKQRAVLEAEMRLQADFLHDLFAENYVGHETIGLRASLLGIDLLRPWDLIVIEPDKPEADPGANHLTADRTRLLDVVRRTARARSPGSVVIGHGEGIVVLRPVASGAAGGGSISELAEAVREQVRRAFRETARTVSVGIGGRCEALADFGQRYAEARRALEVSRSLGQKDRVQTLAAFGVYAILFQQGNEQALLSFALRALGPLLEYDRRRHTALVATLDAYLAERGALRRTAARLDVHHNTLRGRLVRIRETAGVDLADATVRLNLQLALEIYRLGHDTAHYAVSAAPGRDVPGGATVAEAPSRRTATRRSR